MKKRAKRDRIHLNNKRIRPMNLSPSGRPIVGPWVLPQKWCSPQCCRRKPTCSFLNSERHPNRWMEGPNNGYCSSSGEEDGDARWRAAIDSIAGTTSYISSLTNGSSSTSKEKSATKYSHLNDYDDDDQQKKPQTQQIKRYQVKVNTFTPILRFSTEVAKASSISSHARKALLPHNMDKLIGPLSLGGIKFMVVS